MIETNKGGFPVKNASYWRRQCIKLEEQVKDLKFINKQLEDKLYLAKVQESLTRPIVDEYGKAS